MASTGAGAGGVGGRARRALRGRTEPAGTISHDDGAVSVATSTNAADDTSGRAARSVALTSCDHVRVRVSGGGRAGGAGGRGGRSGGAPSRRAPSRMTTAPSASPPPPTPTTTPPAHRWRHSEPCERKMMSSMVGMAITGAGGEAGAQAAHRAGRVHHLA
jgi:hypothetical protein